jgi:hypothetical protein
MGGARSGLKSPLERGWWPLGYDFGGCSRWPERGFGHHLLDGNCLESRVFELRRIEDDDLRTGFS